MKKLLKNISVFWFFVLPIVITIVVLISILPVYMESNVTRITRRDMGRSLISITRYVETTLRTLMINDPRKMTDFHSLLDSLRGDRKSIEHLNQSRQARIGKLDNALRLLSEEERFQIADDSAVKKLWQKYGPQTQKLTLLSTQPGLQTTIIPAPIVRDEMLEKGLRNHPERYPPADEIETLVIATGRQYRGVVAAGEQQYLQITSPILAGPQCMKCHLSAIEGQPLAAITVRADLTENISAVAILGRRVLMFGLLIILVVVLVVLLLSRYLTASLNKLKYQLLRFDEGDTTTPISSQGIREIVTLASCFERTRIRTHGFFHHILKHLPDLIFLVEQNGKATHIYSQRVQDLFGKIENQNINQIIFLPRGSDIRPILEMAFAGNPSMSFEEVTALAPGELKIKEEFFKLNYYPIYQEAPQKLVNILVIGKNITALKQMEMTRATEQKQHQAIIEIVKNPVGFLEFYNESRRLLESGQIMMNRGKGLLREIELIEIRRILNTIKNTAHVFQIRHLTALPNNYKGMLSEIMDSRQPIERKKVYPILTALAKELEKNYRIYQKYVGDQEQADLITITKNEVQTLSEKHPDLQTETAVWQQQLQLDFIRRKATSVVQETAHQLGKEVKLVVDGEEGRISERTAKTISLVLTHLIGNAITHGIEDPMIREAVGKWPQGEISIQVQNKRNNIQIRVHDNGKGIRQEDLVRSAIERGLIVPGTKLDPQKTLNLIFRPGFSTTKKISRRSRLDVGLDAVKSAVNKNKGIITVRSEAGVGTEFIVMLHRNPT